MAQHAAPGPGELGAAGAPWLAIDMAGPVSPAGLALSAGDTMAGNANLLLVEIGWPTI